MGGRRSLVLVSLHTHCIGMLSHREGSCWSTHCSVSSRSGLPFIQGLGISNPRSELRSALRSETPHDVTCVKSQNPMLDLGWQVTFKT